MKVIQVNQTSIQFSLAEQRRMSLQIRQIVSYFLKKRIRNKSLLINKKEITIVFLTSSQMKKINWNYRKKNKPTDILSFLTQDPASLGELLLCPQVLNQQAKRLAHSLQDETLYMLIHGILHLLGYDHEISKKEEALMFRLQDQCFKSLV